jgi:signal peptidase I
MEPTLLRGDLIVVQGGLDFSELTVGYMTAAVPGEIIVYRVPPQYGYMSNDPIVHRAVEKFYNPNDSRWYFTTKGDANSQVDFWSPISQDYIIGRVVGKVPWLGNLSLLMREHPFEGFLLIAILIIISIFVDFGFPKKKKNSQIKTEALI